MMTSKQQLFDTHCHFDFAPFASAIPKHLSLSVNVGVSKLLVPAIAESNWMAIQSLAKNNPDRIVYALGFHPYFLDVSPSESQFAILESLLSQSDPRCVAVGECGLDGVIEVDMALQVGVFERQITLAKTFGLPLILHARKTHAAIIALLKRHHFSCGGILHGFSGSEQQAREFIQLGFKIGVGGVITYPRANKTRNSIANLPLESLVLETDAPDMPLNGFQGEANHPKMLRLVFDQLAELRGSVDREFLAEQLWKNSHEILRLPFD
jgi:TatD DNase family protein